MESLGFALGGYKFWLDADYLNYRSVYAQSFRVLLVDIEAVSIDAKGRGKSTIKINGKGVTLAEVTLPTPWCEKAQVFIQQHIKKPEKNPHQLSDLEKLAELREKGILSEEEFTAKKKQILGL